MTPEEKFNELFDHLTSGRIDEAIRMVREETDININEKGRRNLTPLDLAVTLSLRPGNQGRVLELIRALVEKGADIEARYPGGNTALLLAAIYGNRDLMNNLIAIGADIQARNTAGSTALHIAVERNNPYIVSALVEGGAAIGALDERGRTPLHLSNVATDPNIVNLLLERGADVNTLDINNRSAIRNQDIPDHLRFALMHARYGAVLGLLNSPVTLRGMILESLIDTEVLRQIYSTRRLPVEMMWRGLRNLRHSVEQDTTLSQNVKKRVIKGLDIALEDLKPVALLSIKSQRSRSVSLNRYRRIHDTLLEMQLVYPENQDIKNHLKSLQEDNLPYIRSIIGSMDGGIDPENLSTVSIRDHIYKDFTTKRDDNLLLELTSYLAPDELNRIRQGLFAAVREEEGGAAPTRIASQNPTHTTPSKNQKPSNKNLTRTANSNQGLHREGAAHGGGAQESRLNSPTNHARESSREPTSPNRWQNRFEGGGAAPTRSRSPSPTQTGGLSRQDRLQQQKEQGRKDRSKSPKR
ncbi:hypothetical protein phytr_9090 [Candidatus Phycorickettsia trachydisci]|uniref:Uncharacterized protein n=1 Tax=Candidatus Phycorickettsia trachydisci TaxID=2115978 RepID=A0A2P1P990_9RICK|nr:ankyrin repeat domain-containing protein [Candidatus Phycorickettsia trachydisci]AVP87838.1 hypothetical protein phytr_9090 [Candidatus Phycorickettsia trachydisci]